MLAHAAGEVGDPQVRHRGTIGGSVSHADPASDLATVLLTLDADLVARGSGGERTIPVGEFFTGPFSNALAHDEVLVEIRVPKVERGVYLKHSRRAQDWATVAVAAADVGGHVNVGLASMGPTPLRARAVEDALARCCVPGRRGVPYGRGDRPAGRRERQRRVSGASRAGARPAGARAALADPRSYSRIATVPADPSTRII